MRKKVARTVLALAATIPLTFIAVNAQSYPDEDIAIYAQELNNRIEQGRSAIAADKYNNLRDLWNKIDTIRRQYGNKQLGAMERNNMMASLTNLDRQLTEHLHDEQNSHWQNWDPNTKSWRQAWWKNRPNVPNNNSATANFNEEIDAYQRSLKARLDRGRANGKITPSEYGRLISKYNALDRAQVDYRRGGFNFTERNSLMTMLTQLDRDLTAELRDDNESRFRYWDPNKNTWNQNWWKPGWTASNTGGGGWMGGGSNSAGNVQFNEEIDSYQRDLKARMDRARASGRLNPAEMAKLNAAYDRIDRMQRDYRSGGFNATERNSLMSMLTQLDRDITAQARDDQNSRYRYWDPNKNTWNQAWWKPGWTAPAGNPNDTMKNSTQFGEEINQYQAKLRQEINRGERSGQLTAAESAELMREYDAIDALQKSTRSRGFTRGERDTLVQRLKALESKIDSASRNNISQGSAADRRRDAKEQERDARNDRRDDRRGWTPGTSNSGAAVNTPPATPAATAPATTTPAVTPGTPPATTKTSNADDDNDRDGRRRGGRGRRDN